MHENEIWQVATSLLKSDATQAFAFSVQRANDFLGQGDAAAAATWIRIARVVEDLRRQKPMKGEAIH